MSFDEAVSALNARAPRAEWRGHCDALGLTGLRRQEELAYLIAKWVKKEMTDEEAKTIGFR